VRSTRKYWVHTEDVSRVKYVILQHLPVFLQNTMAGETDSQLVNSVSEYILPFISQLLIVSFNFLTNFICIYIITGINLNFDNLYVFSI
jgi:SPX domain protein involved in polyphosphate accumulation